jgi:hypothetical protein
MNNKITKNSLPFSDPTGDADGYLEDISILYLDCPDRRIANIHPMYSYVHIADFITLLRIQKLGRYTVVQGSIQNFTISSLVLTQTFS